MSLRFLQFQKPRSRDMSAATHFIAYAPNFLFPLRFSKTRKPQTSFAKFFHLYVYELIFATKIELCSGNWTVPRAPSLNFLENTSNNLRRVHLVTDQTNFISDCSMTVYTVYSHFVITKCWLRMTAYWPWWWWRSNICLLKLLRAV